MSRLRSLLEPRSVAVVGANDDATTFGGRVWRYLIRDFAGNAMAVNRRSGAVSTAPCAERVSDLPCTPELIVLATPAHAVGGVLAEAGSLGVRAAVVLSRDALGQEDELRALCDTARIDLLGPNCLGLIHANARVALSSSVSLESPLRPGPLALVAQSGALMGMLHARACDAGLGLGLCVSTGSQAVVRSEDLLLELVADERIESIGLYVEDLDAERFAEAAEGLRDRGARVIALKGGMTAPGSVSTASHSRALASDGRAFARLARDLGVIVVDDPGQLLAALAVSASSGPRWHVVSLSGGLSAVAADHAARGGLDLPAPGPWAARRLAEMNLPQTANPVDLDASSSTVAQRVGLIEELVRDQESDGVLLVINDMPGLDELMAALAPTVAEHAGQLVVCSECSAQFVMVMRSFIKSGGWYADGLGDTIRALAQFHGGEPHFAHAPQGATPDQLAPEAIRALLSEHDIPLLPVIEVETEYEAVAAADELGYPVVLKVARAAHRGAAGVRLSLPDAGAAAAAFAELSAYGSVLVQPQAPSGMELYVGAWTDPTFGTLLLLGAGGDVEILGDVAVAPVAQAEGAIHDLLLETVSGRWLLGSTIRELFDLAAFERVVDGVIRLAQAHGSRLASLDLNPVIVHSHGVSVVDAKLRLAALAPTAQ